MKIIYKRKSSKTCNRIKEIQIALHSYRESMALLQAYKEGSKTLKGGNYVDRAAFYRRSDEDDQRYYWTLNNIKQQMQFLEIELDVLYQFGA